MESITLTEQKNMLSKGYWRTSLGLLPSDWKIVKLSEYIESLDAGVSVNSEDYPANPPEKGILKTSAVNDGRFFPTENKLIKPNELHRAKLNPIKDSIIISRMNTPELVGEIGYVDKDYPHLFLPDRLWQTRYKGNVCGKWLAYLLTIPNLKRQIKNIATGTSNSMKNISKTAFLSLEVPLVPIKEQQKIADILSTWDKAIELKEKLIEQKKEQKKGLMQRLLTGKVRLPGFEGEWMKVKLGEVSEVIMGQSPPSDSYNEIQNGLPLIQGNADCDNRKTSPRIWTSHPTKTCEVGDIIMTVRAPVGYVSRSIHKACIGRGVCAIRGTSINQDFLYYQLIFKEDQWKRISQGSTFDSVNSNAIKGLIVSLPPTEEQLEISNTLMVSDKEIDLLEQELEALKQQKKG